MHFTTKHAKIWQTLKLIRRRKKEITKEVMLLQRKKNFRNIDTFHRAIRPCLLVAHFFGLMPLVNALHYNPYYVRFKIPCWAFTSTLLFFIFGGMKFLHLAGKMFAIGLNPKNIHGIVFFSMCFIVCIYFLMLAQTWPAVIRYWTHIDLLFLMPPYRPPKWSVRQKIQTLTVTFWLIAIVEHCMYHASCYHNFRMRRLHCHPNDTRHTFKDFVIMEQFQDVFTYFPYHFTIATYAFFLSATLTVIWNFMDFFILVLSLGLATRFQQFAARIELLSGNYVPDALWNQIRRHHIILCEFMEYLNDHVSTVVFISCLNNMYFICNQLLSIFTKLRYPINYAYFWFSLIYLLTRTFCVFMFASTIHDASVLPLKTLYLVPSGCWTEEVQRFMAQIVNEELGLTGRRFYLLTRKGFFGMMGTLITYEFMLLQFDTKSREMGLPDLCA